jgi:membrane dipeptidase
MLGAVRVKVTIDRRRVLQLGLATLAACAARRRADAPRAGPAAAYRRALVIDALGGPDGDPHESNPDALLWNRGVADAVASGITAVNLTIAAVDDDWATMEKAAAWVDRELAARPDAFLRVLTAADLRAAKASGRLGLIYGTESLAMIGEDVDRLDAMHARGVRIAQLTYNLAGALGTGCLAPEDRGLSELGRAAIARMERLGITVDLAHASPKTVDGALAAATGPVVFSHTGCAAVNPHPRNVSDAALRACADRGGVAGIYFMPFLRAAGQPTSDDVIRHLEHAIEVAGEDGVGIGTDGAISTVVVDEQFRENFRKFVRDRKAKGVAAPGEDENVFMFVPELNTPRKLETLAERLAARGHRDARIEKILGGNFARVFGDTWRG